MKTAARSLLALPVILLIATQCKKTDCPVSDVQAARAIYGDVAPGIRRYATQCATWLISQCGGGLRQQDEATITARFESGVSVKLLEKRGVVAAALASLNQDADAYKAYAGCIEDRARMPPHLASPQAQLVQTFGNCSVLQETADHLRACEVAILCENASGAAAGADCWEQVGRLKGGANHQLSPALSRANCERFIADLAKG
jgi:hypothetical protein